MLIATRIVEVGSVAEKTAIDAVERRLRPYRPPAAACVTGLQLDEAPVDASKTRNVRTIILLLDVKGS
jgi:hypothetical protein